MDFNPRYEAILSIEPLIVVLFCTMVQNIFGVGILVFGTPVLLSLGYDFVTTLGILLPSSLLVSVTQIVTIKNAVFPTLKVFVHSVIGVALGATLLITYCVPVFIYIVTALAMLFAGGLRLRLDLRDRVGYWMARPYLKFYFLNGIFHGFSNLGGILLVLKNNLDTVDKNQALMSTASVYLIYVMSQIVVFLILGNHEPFRDGLVMSPLIALFSIVLGNKPLTLLSVNVLDNALGIFFILVSFVLSYKVFHLI